MNIENSRQLFWSLTPEEIESLLETDLKNGLKREKVGELLKKYGPNRLKSDKIFSKVWLFLKQFKSPLIFILIFAGLVTIFLQHCIDAVIIFMAISVNAALGFYQENKAETALMHLKSYLQERCRVIRDNKEIEIDSVNILPGDIVYLTMGGRVPADGRLFSLNNLKVDEAILTGESMPVSKNTEILSEAASLPDRTNMVFGGTLITEGNGLMVVTATGQNTEVGKIAHLVLKTAHEKTPLQKSVAGLAWIISIIILVSVIAIFSFGLYKNEPIFDMFLVSVAIAVGAIPEALPIGLTAVLAVGVERLARKKGIMRNLGAAETLGSSTIIMTDKTGTLTEAKMQLVNVFSLDKLINYKDHQPKTVSRHFDPEQKDILTLAAFNTDVLIENGNQKTGDWILTGNPLEVNIVKSAAQHDIDFMAEKNKGGFHIIFPFNSKNKFSVSCGNLSKIKLSQKYLDDKNQKTRIIVGAPDILLQKSTLSKDAYIKASESIEILSEEGKRLLAVCLSVCNNKHDKLDDLMVLGILAFYDPIRKGAAAAIRKMESYGVRVVMATGDLKGTASAVARDLGWQINKAEILTGEEIRQMSDSALKESLTKVRIFARVTPEDKMRIGKLFQQRGEVVAMTGDGVNDAPSLKAVDIGVALGSGSDVAKGVVDLVLLDDNFDTIVVAIEEGKKILKNLRKSFVYLMSNSLDGVIVIGGSLLVGLSLPLTAVQIIWINFFTGSWPAIAFAFDHDNDFHKKEFKGDKNILDNEVKFLTLGIGLLSSVLLFLLYWFLMSVGLPESLAKTFLFACFASYILFLAFSLKNLHKPIYKYNIFSNKFLVLGVLIGLVLLLATLYIPYLQKAFSTVTLSWGWLSLVAVWVLFNIVLVEVAKWLFYRR